MFLLACLTLHGAAHGQTELAPLPTDEQIGVHIAEGEPGSGYRPEDRDLASWALEAWERSASGALDFEPVAEPADALVRVRWVPASAGQYGEMRNVIVNGRRGAEVFIRPDTAALGPEIARRAGADPLLRDAIVYLTCLHELGHALGLVHTDDFRDVMYFFGYGGDIVAFFNRYRAELTTRSDIAGATGLSGGDLDQLRRLYDVQ